MNGSDLGRELEEEKNQGMGLRSICATSKTAYRAALIRLSADYWKNFNLFLFLCQGAAVGTGGYHLVTVCRDSPRH